MKLSKKYWVLIILIIVIPTVLILGMPLLPSVSFQVKEILEGNDQGEFDDLKSLKDYDVSLNDTWILDKNKNSIFIPEINLKSQINEGADEDVLTKGLWRRPNASTPLKGGNTVISGHNFRYFSGSPTLYHLNKLEEQDVILVYWDKKVYLYEVYEKFVTDPKDMSVEDTSDEDILTVYTCYPLYTSEKRLVVRAKLLEA